MSSDAPGHGRPHLRVRYYPRRVARPPVAEPLSPGQALHLVNDPRRAALARHTADGHELAAAASAPRTPAPAVVPAQREAPAAPAIEVAEPVRGWRRWWDRLTRRAH